MNLPRNSMLGDTKVKVAGLLLEKKQTANGIAIALGIRVSAVRKHLDSMEDIGLVTHEFTKAGVGRPKKLYALTETGRELFPNQYSNMLDLLISGMLRNREAWQVEDMLESVATEVGSKIKNEADSENPDDIFNVLNKFGFEARMERVPDEQSKDNGEESLFIVSKNCPLFRVASKHPNPICNSFHGTLLRIAFSTDEVELKSCMANGADFCRHHVVSHTSIENENRA